MRKGLTIAAVVIVLIGIAVGIYFIFFNTGGGLTTENGLSDNPFGNPSGDITPGGIDSGNGEEEDTGDTVTQVAPRLVKIASKPVAAGAVVVDPVTPVVSLASSTATSTPAEPSGVEVRYIDRESGNMYVYKALDGETGRLTNRTIPGAQEAAWLSDGKMAFVRIATDDVDSEHIETYALPADGTEGYFLSRDLAQVIPVATTTIFTFLPSSSGSIGTIGKPDGSNATTLSPTSQRSASALRPTASAHARRRLQASVSSLAAAARAALSSPPSSMLPRQRRLSRTGFGSLTRARKAQSLHLSLSWSTDTAHPGMAAVVSKKVAAQAVDRHLLKRRILAVLRDIALPNTAVVVFAKPGSANLPFPALKAELKELLGAIQ